MSVFLFKFCFNLFFNCFLLFTFFSMVYFLLHRWRIAEPDFKCDMKNNGAVSASQDSDVSFSIYIYIFFVFTGVNQDCSFTDNAHFTFCIIISFFSLKISKEEIMEIYIFYSIDVHNI